MMYKTMEIETQYGTQVCIIRTSDNSHISSDETHRDYQEYLAWVEQGNTAEAWSPNDN